MEIIEIEAGSPLANKSSDKNLAHAKNDVGMKAITASLLIFITAQSAFAKTMTDRYVESKNIVGLYYEDEKTGEKCVISQDQRIIEASGVPACTNEQEEFIKEINDAPKNPDMAIAGVIVDVALGYYTLCSLAQVAPYVAEKMDEATDDRSRGEKLKDIVLPSEERRKRNSLIDTVTSVSKDMTTTVCSPVANLNKKLFYLLSDKK